MIFLKKLISESFQTNRGSKITRYKNNVGKQMGSKIYVHKQYAPEIVPSNIWKKTNEILNNFSPNFKYNTVMFDVKSKAVRFDESPDFDTSREPHVGKYIVVYMDDKQPKYGQSNNIWHHKWLWVKDDYTGFDVDKSKKWSRVWLSKLNEPAKGSDITWNKQLKQYSLSKIK